MNHDPQKFSNTRHPASKPHRVDRFTDDLYESTVELAKELSVINRSTAEEVQEKQEKLKEKQK